MFIKRAKKYVAEETNRKSPTKTITIILAGIYAPHRPIKFFFRAKRCIKDPIKHL